MASNERFYHRITFIGLVVLCLAMFTSVSASSLFHVSLFLSGSFFTVKAFRDQDFKFKKSWWALLFLSLSCIVSVVLNWGLISEPWKNILKVKYFLIALLSYSSFYYFKRDFVTKKQVSLLINLFLLATTVATISGLIALRTGFNPLKMKPACHETRACGLYGMYMTYGYGISLFMVLLTSFLHKKQWLFRHTSKLFFYSCYFINLVGLILSYTRGAWLGFFLALPFFFFKEHKKKFLIISFLSVLSLACSITFIPQVRGMFTQRTQSNNQRLAFYEAAYYAWKEKPIFGWGYRNFEPNVPQIKKRNNVSYPSIGGHAHNNFLEHLAATGIVGGLAFILFVALWLVESYKYNFILPFVVSFLISGLFQYTFGDGENLFLILTVFAFL